MFRAISHFILIVFLISGCTTLPRYKAAEPHYAIPGALGSANLSVVIHLESVFVGKRFDEVVCDNVFGAIWNPEEATKIGFTQDYAEILPKILPLMAFEASLPYNIGIGRVASGESSLAFDRMKINSRIMVPFGTYISRNLEQLAFAGTRKSVVCFDKKCVQENKRAVSADRIVTVQFTKFKVAEDKPNRLTLVAQATVTVEDSSGNRRISEVQHEIVERSITSEGYFHGDFLRVMDKMANELASAIADQILARTLAENA